MKVYESLKMLHLDISVRTIMQCPQEGWACMIVQVGPNIAAISNSQLNGLFVSSSQNHLSMDPIDRLNWLLIKSNNW